MASKSQLLPERQTQFVYANDQTGKKKTMCVNILKSLGDNFIIAFSKFNELCKAGIATSPPVIISAKRNKTKVAILSKVSARIYSCWRSISPKCFKVNCQTILFYRYFRKHFILRLYLRRAKRGCISLFLFERLLNAPDSIQLDALKHTHRALYMLMPTFIQKTLCWFGLWRVAVDVFARSL
jgi:hypothetical protein